MEVIDVAPRRVLVVTPHPDDAEGGCGGTIARWIKAAGTEVVLVLCTNGDKGTADENILPEKLATIREREQREASAVLGVKEVVSLSHPDGGLEDTAMFRGQLVRELRRHRPDVMFCMDPYRSVSHAHRDHRLSGQVAIDAAFTYAWSYHHYPEQITMEGLKPHRLGAVYLWGSEKPDVCVEISDYLELKLESLGKHSSQFIDWANQMERVRRRAAIQGEAAGVPNAESFRRVNFDIGSLSWRYMNS
jgi:LmbE family N-acetylglucosaminyl deacetylase